MAIERIDAIPVSYVAGSSQVLAKELGPMPTATGTSSNDPGGPHNRTDVNDNDGLNPLGTDRFVTDELESIQMSFGTNNNFLPQVANQEPAQLYRGLIRYCKSPWDPIGTGYEGLVTYDGTTWARLGLDYDSQIATIEADILTNAGAITSLGTSKADVSHTHAYTDVNTFPTARLTGRTTAGTGSLEAITVGTGLTLSAGNLSAVDQSKSVAILNPNNVIMPTTDYATLGSRNNHIVLEFADGATQESGEFTFALPTNYVAQGLNVRFFFTSDAVSGTGGFDVAIEAILGLDIDADSYDTAVLGTPVTVSATAGTVIEQTIALADTDLDGAGASEPVRMRIRRDTPNDTAASDLQLLLIVVELQ